MAKQSVAGFLSALAAKTPAPGGGATACLAGALACAQAEMVVAYSLGKKNLAEHQELLAGAAQELVRARGMLLELADEDAAAYGELNRLMKLAEGDAERAKLPVASEQAAMVPLSAMAVCGEVARVCAELEGKSNAMLRSDLEIARGLAEVAGWACSKNVAVNLAGLVEPALGRVSGQLAALKGKVPSRWSND